MTIRDATSADLPSILQLNQQSVHFLSPLDQARLEDKVLGSEQNCCAILDLTRKVDFQHPTKCWGQSKIAAQFLI